MSKADILTSNYGSIITFQPETDRGVEWVKANVPDAKAGGSFYADPRCGVDIINGMLDSGLRVKDTRTRRLARRLA